LRQLAPLFGISKSAADRIIDDVGPKLALRPRKRFAPNTVLIVDGTLVPTRDRTIAAPSKNYRYSTNHQVVIDADTQLVVAIGTPLPGNRNDCKAFGESGAEHACRNTTRWTACLFTAIGIAFLDLPATLALTRVLQPLLPQVDVPVPLTGRDRIAALSPSVVQDGVMG
jgi:hypothetical protein